MRQQVLVVLALGWLLAISPAARAEIITFDDISVSSGSTAVIPNGYHGLNWTNFKVVNTTGLPVSGFVNGTVSPTNVAFNGEGANAKIDSDTPFDLNSGYFTAAFREGLKIHAFGFSNGNQVYHTTFEVNTTGPTFVSLEFLDIDRAMFIATGGKPNKQFNGTGQHFVLDDLIINQQIEIQVERVPEPTSLALLGVGTAMMGLYSWRRRRARIAE